MIAPVVLYFIFAFSTAQAFCSCNQTDELTKLNSTIVDLRENQSNFLLNYTARLEERFNNLFANDLKKMDRMLSGNYLRNRTKGLNIDECVRIYERELKSAYNVIVLYQNKKCIRSTLRDTAYVLDDIRKNEKESHEIYNVIQVLNAYCQTPFLPVVADCASIIEVRIEKANPGDESVYKKAESAKHSIIEKYRACYTGLPATLQAVKSHERTKALNCIKEAKANTE